MNLRFVHGNLYSINWNPLKTNSKCQLEFLLKKKSPQHFKGPQCLMTPCHIPQDLTLHLHQSYCPLCVRACVCVCVCVCARACVHACLYIHVYVHYGDVFPGPNELRTQPWKSFKRAKSLVPHPCRVTCKYRAPRHPFYINVGGCQRPSLQMWELIPGPPVHPFVTLTQLFM